MRRRKKKRKTVLSRKVLANKLYWVIKKKAENEEIPEFDDFYKWLKSRENFEYKYFRWGELGYWKYGFPKISKIDKNDGWKLENLKFS